MKTHDTSTTDTTTTSGSTGATGRNGAVSTRSGAGGPGGTGGDGAGGGPERRTAAQTQALIEAEARRLFNLKGYVGMTLREVASGVGIEAQSLYNYTRSKQDLVASLMQGGTAAIQRAVDAALAAAGPTPPEQLWAALHAHTLHYCASDQVVLVREGLVHLDDDHRAALMGMLKTYEDTFKDLLRRGVESGDLHVPDVTPTCFALLGMGETVVNWFHPGRRLTAEDVATQFADLGLRSVLADPTRDPRPTQPSTQPSTQPPPTTQEPHP